MPHIIAQKNDKIHENRMKYDNLTKYAKVVNLMKNDEFRLLSPKKALFGPDLPYFKLD